MFKYLKVIESNRRNREVIINFITGDRMAEWFQIFLHNISIALVKNPGIALYLYPQVSFW